MGKRRIVPLPPHKWHTFICNSSTPPVACTRSGQSYPRSLGRAYTPSHPLAIARSRRTVCGGRSVWCGCRPASGRSCREPWTSEPCVQGPEIAPRVLPPEGLGGRGQVKPDASTGSPRAAVKWLVEGRTGHKPRSCGEALVLTTRRLPAPGSEPRHAAIPCGTAYPHNRAAGQ